MIRLEGLRVQAGDFELAVDDLAIATGEYVMVLGPTASGKTVLLETVAGLRRPRGGRLWLGERDVTAAPPEKRGAALVYQDYALFPHLTAAENIAFGLRARRARGFVRRVAQPVALKTTTIPAPAADDRVRALIGLLGIEGLVGRYPEGLSGGERQRVALARALAIEPEVLLLDEPLSALDGQTRTELRGELRRVHKRLGATVMHVTHDLDEALALGDRVAVLIDGRLRQVGPPQQVTRHPADVEVARLVGLTNVFPLAGPNRLMNGWQIRGAVPQQDGSPSGGRTARSAVIRADEIELEPVVDSHADETTGVVSAGPGVGSTDASLNVLIGRVKAIQVQSVHAAVQVEAEPLDREYAPLVLTAYLLRPEIAKMGIGEGSPVRVRFPASAVHVCDGA